LLIDLIHAIVIKRDLYNLFKSIQQANQTYITTENVTLNLTCIWSDLYNLFKSIQQANQTYITTENVTLNLTCIWSDLYNLFKSIQQANQTYITTENVTLNLTCIWSSKSSFVRICEPTKEYTYTNMIRASSMLYTLKKIKVPVYRI